MKDDLPFAVQLSFNGNCLQAFNYYQHCFGGELTVQTMKDSPYGSEMSKEMQEAVICATLNSDYFKLMGTDLTDEDRIIPGNNISIVIVCDSFAERSRIIRKLAGENVSSFEHTNPLINIIDRYSIQWILCVS